jgi:hypothetical protein
MHLEPDETDEEIAGDPLHVLNEAALDVRVAADVLEKGIYQAPDVLPHSIREIAAGLGRTLSRSAERVALAAQKLQGARDAAHLLAEERRSGSPQLLAVKDDPTPPPPATGPVVAGDGVP